MSNTVNKSLYKIFLLIMKHVPVILGITQIICLILNYLGKNILLLSCFGGTSFMFIGILFIFSYLFKFCYLYRIPLYYITITTILTSVDALIGIPIETILLYRIHGIIAGISSIAYIIYAIKNKNRPCINYIDRLCDNSMC